MAIVRWDPWRELASVERQFDELFGRFGRQSEGGRSINRWAPALDVHQEGETMVICADVAGVPPEDVEITVEDNVLTISGSRNEDRTVEEGNWIRRERQTGRFQRSISLPPGVDAGAIEANAQNGVIEIRVPQPRSSEPHRVQLQGSQQQSSEVPITEGSSANGPNSSSNPGSAGMEDAQASPPKADNSASKSRTQGSAAKAQKSTTKRGQSSRR